jgi:DNA repair exonuclease SbcCD ATPase subunit
LAQLVGLDLSTVEAQRKQAYEQRRDINRDVKRLQIELASCGEPTPAPAVPDLDAAERAVTTARAAERAHQEHKAQADTDRRAFDQASKRVADIKRQIVDLQRQLLDADEVLGDAEIAAQASAQAAAQSSPAIGVDTLMDTAKQAREAKSRHDLWQLTERRRTDKARELAAASKQADKLTAAIAALDVQASAAVQACQFPLPQLTIAENIVRYGDVPFDQCSSAEQLRISTAIAMRLNPKLRIIRITDGSLLDSENFRMLSEMATENDYQVWVEVVESANRSAVLIENGEVSSQTEEAAA